MHVNGYPKICVSSINFKRDFMAKRMDVRSFLKKCTRFGVDAVELCDRTILSTRRSDLRSLDISLKTSKIKLQAIAIRNDFSLADHGAIGKSIDHVRKWLLVAAFLRVPVVRIWAGESSADDKAYHRVLLSIKKIVPLAEKLGIRMALENHGGVSLNPDNVMRLVRGVKSPCFGTCPDFGNFLPADRCCGVQKIIKNAFHIHAKSYEFDQKGQETTIDYKTLITSIKAAGYGGYFSIEYEGEKNADKGVRSTISLIKKYWSGPWKN